MVPGAGGREQGVLWGPVVLYSRRCFSASTSASKTVWKASLFSELLNGEIFHTLLEARVIIERWRGRGVQHHQTNSSVGFRPPAPEPYQPLPLANG